MTHIRIYFRDLVQLLTEPKSYFRDRFPELTFSQALTFGVVSNWIAAFLGWLTRTLKHETLLDGMMKMREQLSQLPYWKDLPDTIWQQGQDVHNGPLSSPWAVELLGIFISPFQSLFNFCISGIVIFVGAWVLIPKNEESGQDKLEVSGFIKLIAIASAPSLVGAILGFLPFGLNSLIGFIYTLTILIIGIASRYKVSSLRSAGVILLPGILAMTVLGCLIFGLGALIMGLVAAFFGGSHG
jgi:hypothetical protein